MDEAHKNLQDAPVMTHLHIVSPGKFAPRPKSKAQSSDGEGLGNDVDDGPGNEDDEGGDDDE